MNRASARRPRLFSAAALLVVSPLVAVPAPEATAQQVAPASYEESSSPRASNQHITFQRRSPQVGDQVDQTLLVETQMKNIVRQGQQIVEEATSGLKQRERRLVTTAEVEQGLLMGATVRYVNSARELSAPDQENRTEDEPVAGHTYRCRREGEKLLVTDSEGNMPPLAEYEIVAHSMESLGKANPLGEFLRGKTITVGERLTLPQKMAEQLLGLGDAIDQVERFDMTLREVTTLHGQPCAVFSTLVEASDHRRGQMRMQLEGTLTIDRDSCRLVVADLAGPIGIAESILGAGTTYHLTGTGRMSVSIESQYKDLGN